MLIWSHVPQRRTARSIHEREKRVSPDPEREGMRACGMRDQALTLAHSARGYTRSRDLSPRALTPLLELPQLPNSNPTLHTLFE